MAVDGVPALSNPQELRRESNILKNFVIQYRREIRKDAHVWFFPVFWGNNKKQVLREIECLQNIDNEFVVALHQNYAEDNGTTVLVFELLNFTLLEVIENLKPLPEKLIEFWTLQLFQGNFFSLCKSCWKHEVTHKTALAAQILK